MDVRGLGGSPAQVFKEQAIAVRILHVCQLGLPVYSASPDLFIRKKSPDHAPELALLEAFMAARVIIFVSPIYLHQVPAVFKGWLEYLSPLCHSFGLHHRYFLDIVHANSNGILPVSFYLRKIGSQMGMTHLEVFHFTDLYETIDVDTGLRVLVKRVKEALDGGCFRAVDNQESSFQVLKRVYMEGLVHGITSVNHFGWRVLSGYDSYQDFLDHENLEQSTFPKGDENE